MLEESVFGSMMLPGRSPEGLKLHRGEAGFAQNLAEGYGEYYSEEDLEAYFTLYSYANLNVTYEDSLKKLYEIRVSEAGSHSFLSKIQSLVSRLVPADGEELERILGSDYDDLYPLINIEPLINVNFAHKEILRAVLYYPYGGERVEHASDYLDILTAERTTMEIAPEKLDITLALEGPSLRIRDYLGTNTWFWKITASEGDLRLEAVICRIPGEADEEPLYRIIEWKYY